MPILVVVLTGFMVVCPATAQTRGARSNGHAPAKTTEALIEETDRNFAKALVEADLAALDRTYADTYIFTNPNGRVSTKSDLIKAFRDGTIKIEFQEISDVKVQVYGDVAVETGKLTSRAKWAGKDSSGVFRFTRVWLESNGRWVTVAFQETSLK